MSIYQKPRFNFSAIGIGVNRRCPKDRNGVQSRIARPIMKDLYWIMSWAKSKDQGIAQIKKPLNCFRGSY